MVMPSIPTGNLTLLFTDIESSTRLWEQAPDAMDGALRRHDELLHTAVGGSAGYVFKTVGDSFCVAFPTAADAVGAAASAQKALAIEPWPEGAILRVRMAIHTGACVERDGDYFGPTVNRVARLEATAHGGQVLLSQTTNVSLGDNLPAGLSLRHLGSHRLKDLGRPEEIY
jgi:class 3 adenylate cyclase